VTTTSVTFSPMTPLGETPIAAAPSPAARWLQLAFVIPRAIAFMFGAGRSPRAGVPRLRPSPPTIASVFLDDLVSTFQYVMAGSVEGRLDPDAMERAADALRAGGFFDRPGTFHLPPPPPAFAETRVRVRRRARLVYEHVAYPSGYAPPPDVPGAEWIADERNMRAHAYVLRHDDRPRPWLISIHPTGVGSPMDMMWMGSTALHRELGINVMHPVLPKHGPRRRRGQPRVSFPSPDGIVNLQAFSQSVWDVRRAIAWARLQGATAVGLHGLSLGGYTAALLAGIEDDLDCVVVGLPPSDLPTLMVRHASRYLTAEIAAEGLAPISSVASRDVNRLISPLAFTPRVTRERRFVYAAIGDRVATPEQAVDLWRHWNEPEILWLQSSHLPAPMLSETRRFVRDALDGCGLVGQGPVSAAAVSSSR
jgi:hypothetical protein